MGVWFRRDDPDPPDSQVSGSTFNLDQVLALLDEVGLLRLRIRDPKVKVPLTQIAQLGEEYLKRKSPDGVPSDLDVMEFQQYLEMLKNLLVQYIVIQNDRSQPDREEKLEKGREAVDGIASSVLSSSSPGGSQAMTSFLVDAQLLSAKRVS